MKEFLDWAESHKIATVFIVLGSFCAIMIGVGNVPQRTAVDAPSITSESTVATAPVYEDDTTDFAIAAQGAQEWHYETLEDPMYSAPIRVARIVNAHLVDPAATSDPEAVSLIISELPKGQLVLHIGSPGRDYGCDGACRMQVRADYGDPFFVVVRPSRYADAQGYLEFENPRYVLDFIRKATRLRFKLGGGQYADFYTSGLAFGSIQSYDVASGDIEILTDYGFQNERCRGSSSPAAMEACRDRDAVGRDLEARGWCYGEQANSGADSFWARCAGAKTELPELPL